MEHVIGDGCHTEKKFGKENEICPKNSFRRIENMIMGIIVQRPINSVPACLGTCSPGRYYISSLKTSRNWLEDIDRKYLFSDIS